MKLIQKAAPIQTSPVNKKTDYGDLALKAIPFIGSGIGAAAAGVPGAAAGYAGSAALENMLRDYFKKQDKGPGAQLADVTLGTAGSALGQAAGDYVAAPLLKSLGKKIFGWGITKPLDVAGKEFDSIINQRIAGKTQETFNEKMIKKGLSGDTFDIGEKAKMMIPKIWEKVESLGTKENSGLTITNLAENALTKSKQNLQIFGSLDQAKKAWTKLFKDIKKMYPENLRWSDIVDINKTINAQTTTGSGQRTTSQSVSKTAYKALDDIIKPYISKNNPELSSALADYSIYKSAYKTAKTTKILPSIGTGPVSNKFQLENIFFRLFRNTPAMTSTGSNLYNMGTGSTPMQSVMRTGLHPYLGSQVGEYAGEEMRR